MVTGGHGVRFQYDYTNDQAGLPGSVSGTPRWLRLTRTGDTITGYNSSDATDWHSVGSALAGLPTAVYVGPFVTSPTTAAGLATQATASFDHTAVGPLADGEAHAPRGHGTARASAAVRRTSTRRWGAAATGTRDTRLVSRAPVTSLPPWLRPVVTPRQTHCCSDWYLGLIALLSLGIGTLLRDTAVSTGIVLALLYLPPLLAELVSGPWRRHIQQIAPMTAGLAIQATRNIRSLPISPWAALGVLGTWAAGTLLVGLAVLKARDA